MVVACAPAPACKAALAQASALWPNRSKASDGICASPKHTSQNPTSDHELGNAVDLTHDPANGCDAHRWARDLAARRDPRVKYIISARQIWNPAKSPDWRPYTGSNPHTTHAHVSIHSVARSDTSPWFIVTTEEEVTLMFESHRFVRIPGVPASFYSWDPADSSVYAWNGAPGPILSAEGQRKIREAGGIRDLAYVEGVGLSAIVGQPGANSSWAVWNFRDLGPGDRA